VRRGDRSKLADAAAEGDARKPTRKTSGGSRASNRRSSPPPPTGTARRPGAYSPGPDSVPRQGFESESDIASGSVQPPGAAELVASAAEVVGELAKAGLSAGERLLKDLVARLPRP
jgi:hypothetical protein